MESVRTCVGCGTKRSRDAFVRLVARTDGDVVIDRRRRESGRGANLCANPACLRAWLKKKGSLMRAFKREVHPVNVAEIEKGLSS
ncbi:MAG: YlxR family protein [Deltaproteobacteria bacterium]|nr:YlxR family protein [Deltaproteobacteria bacterium]